MAESTVIDKLDVVTVTNPRTDASAREKLITARIGLLLKAPFFGQLATRMTLTNADAWCGTAATDGRKFYYNSEFVDKMPLKQLEFLVGHEILHAVYDHMGRRGDRQPRLSNIAADYCVNQDLVEQHIGEKISVCPILFDNKFKGMSYEEVYDYLYQNANKIDIKQLEQMLLDEHLEDGDDQDGPGGNGKDNKDGKGRPVLSKEERDAIRDEIKGAVIAAAQSAGAGNLPSGVKRLLKDLTEPVIGWKELLQQQIQSLAKNDYTWARPSRRGWHIDAILPASKPGEMIDVCIALDQSGSISEADSKAFLSEIKGIMESFEEYRITIWCFDTEIYNMQSYTSDNIGDIMEYEPQGGGGTDFMANWEFMKEHNIEPKKFIMFTDGVPFGEWGEESYCETVWIIKGNPGCEPPWGIWAHYEDAVKGR
jgi:predicted metal-dependent peptidase